MGDEPYAALLPWVVFAVVDRAQGDGATWSAIAALITAITLLMTTKDRAARHRNVVLVGAIVWFGALALVSAPHTSYSSLLAHDGRAVSATGFALLAVGSLAFTPLAEHYTRPHVRVSAHHEPAFRHVNFTITAIWALAFVAIASGHALAAALDTVQSSTVLNWIVPIALGTVAAHRSRELLAEFTDDELSDADPLHDFALDWDRPPAE